MDILLGLQGYLPVFTLSILTCPQGLNLCRWRGQVEAGSMSQIKHWRNSALCFPSNMFYPQGEQSRAAPSEILCQERPKQWAETTRKHRTSLKNISSGRGREFVLASEFLALQQGSTSVNKHYTCSYPQYLQGILLCNEKGQRRPMYNENTLEIMANS